MTFLELKNRVIARYKEFRKFNISHEDTIYILQLMFELTSIGFERYISAYFHYVKYYKTEVIGGWTDKGIDIEGLKEEGHKILHLAVQCKKWTYENIPKKEILDFEDNVRKRGADKSYPQYYFVTTNRLSIDAKEATSRDGIRVIDYRKLLEMRKKYSVQEFERQFKKGKYKNIKEGRRFFQYTNVRSVVDGN